MKKLLFQLHSFVAIFLLIFPLPSFADHYIHKFIPQYTTPANSFSTVHTVGDVTNDGVIDFALSTIIGTSGTTGIDRLQIYSGATKSLLHTNDQSWSSGSSHRFGNSVSALGDVNQDGYQDFIVSEPRRRTNCILVQPNPSSEYIGYVFVISGADRQTVLYGSAGGVNENYGEAVQRLGDIDGDQFPDFVVSTPFSRPFGNPCGAVQARFTLYSGRTGSVIYTRFVTSNKGLGETLAVVGDVDGDGKDDFAAGSLSSDIAVFSGIDGTILYYDTTDNNPNTIPEISKLGDINGDGLADFIVGWGRANGSISPIQGKVAVLLGGSYIERYSRFGEGAQDAFGSSIAFLGDVTGDGVADFAVMAENTSSSVYYTNPSNMYVKVYSGVDGALVKKYFGDYRTLSYGKVVGLGLYDSDNIPDFLVAAPGERTSTSTSGLLYFMLSNTPNGDGGSWYPVGATTSACF